MSTVWTKSAGGPWAPDPTPNDDAMHTLNQIRGSDFEVVDTTRLVGRLEPGGPKLLAGAAAGRGCCLESR